MLEQPIVTGPVKCLDICPTYHSLFFNFLLLTGYGDQDYGYGDDCGPGEFFFVVVSLMICVGGDVACFGSG